MWREGEGGVFCSRSKKDTWYSWVLFTAFDSVASSGENKVFVALSAGFFLLAPLTLTPDYP
jgi:hypothetical protein